MSTEENEVETKSDGKAETGETFEMIDGVNPPRKTTFAGKRKIQQTMKFSDDGHWIGNHMDFRFAISDAFPQNSIWVPAPANDFKVKAGEDERLGKEQLAAHGGKQKFGDLAAGIKGEDDQEPDTEDLYSAVREGVDSFYSGTWSERREASGLAGTSVLLRAMVELSQDKGTGKTVQDAREILKSLDAKTKLALRNTPELKPYVDKIEAAKAAKVAKVDTKSVLDLLVAKAVPAPAA